MSETTTLEENLNEVKRSIEQVLNEVERAPPSAQLVAVSKTHGPEKIEPLLQCGHRIFGENRVQEADQKWPDLKEKYPDTELHLIGPLQSNKTRRALELFDVIETVDRPKLAKALARIMEEEGLRRDCYIQINTGEEPQKAGILPRDADAFIDQCVNDLKLPVIGLMCIPPVEEEAAFHFALLREIAKRNGLSQLSMGMSSDYQMALRFGATSVRVGSAIFGARAPWPALSG